MPVNSAEPQGVPVQGVPINNAEPQGVPVQGVPLGGATAKQSPAEWFKDPKHKKIIIGAGAGLVALIVIIVVIILVASAKPTIDIADYADELYEVSGGDGYGTIEIVNKYVWEDAVEEILYEEYKDGDTSALGAFGSLYEYEESIEVEYIIDAENNGNLSNGDTVTITAEISGVDDDFPFKLKCSTIKVEISGLPEVEEVDIFEDIEVNIGGFAPYAYVSSVSSEKWDSLVDYSCEYEGDDENDGECLSNGDSVTITASFDADALATLGYGAKETTMTYTVSGIEAYITDSSELTDDVLKALKSYAVEYIESCWDNSYSTLKKKEYVGAYLYTPKDVSLVDADTDDCQYNRIIIVYKVTGTVDGNSVSYYIAPYYSYVYYSEDGTVREYGSYPSGYYYDEDESEDLYFDGLGSWGWSSVGYYGYTKLDTLKDELGSDNVYYNIEIIGDDLQ